MELTELERDTAYKYLRLALVELSDKIEDENDPDAWDELDIDIGQLNELLDKLANVKTL